MRLRIAMSALGAVVLAVILTPSALGEANPVVHSATGAGHQDDVDTATGEVFNRTFSFSAVQYADAGPGQRTDRQSQVPARRPRTRDPHAHRLPAGPSRREDRPTQRRRDADQLSVPGRSGRRGPSLHRPRQRGAWRRSGQVQRRAAQPAGQGLRRRRLRPTRSRRGWRPRGRSTAATSRSADPKATRRASQHRRPAADGPLLHREESRRGSTHASRTRRSSEASVAVAQHALSLVDDRRRRLPRARRRRSIADRVCDPDSGAVAHLAAPRVIRLSVRDSIRRAAPARWRQHV